MSDSQETVLQRPVDQKKLARRHSFYEGIGVKVRDRRNSLPTPPVTDKTPPSQTEAPKRPDRPAPTTPPVDQAAKTDYEKRLLEHAEMVKALTRYSPATDAKLAEFETAKGNTAEPLKATPPDYARALTALKAVDLKATGEWIKKEGTGWSKKIRDTAKDRAAYEERLVRHNATETDLDEYRPASDKAIAEFVQARLAAAQALKSDPFAYKAANKALHKVHVSTALEKAEESWKSAAKSAHKDPKAEEVYKEIERVKGILVRENKTYFDIEALARVEKFCDQSERKLLSYAKDPTLLEALKKDVSRYADGLADQLTSRRQVYANYVTEQLRLEKKITELSTATPQPLATVEELAMPQRMLRDSKAMAGTTGDYHEAAKLAKIGSDKCDEIKTANTLLRTEWVQGEKDLTKLIDDLHTFRTKTAKAPGVGRSALDLEESLQEERQQGLTVGVDVSLKSMLDKIKAAKVTQADLVKQDDAWVQFDKDRKAADGRITLKKGEAQQAVIAVAGILGDVMGTAEANNALLPFNTRMTSIAQAWAQRLDEQTTIDGLDEVGTTAQYASIVTAAGELTKDPKKLDAQINLGELERQQGEYDHARSVAQEAIDRLAGFDTLAAAPLLKSLKAEDSALANKKSPGGYKAAIGKVVKLGQAAEKTLLAQEKTLGDETGAFEKLAEMIQTTLDALFAATEKMNNMTKRTFHVQLHGELTASFNQVRALAATGQLSLVTQAITDGGPVLDDAKTALAEAKGDKLEDGGKPVYSFAQATKDIARVKRYYGEGEVQTYMLESATKLKEKTEKLEKAMGQRTLAQLDTDVTALIKEAQELRGKAKGGRDEAKKLDEDLEKLATRLGGGHFKTAKGLVEQIKAEIKRIKSVAHYEGGITQARSFYEALLKRINGLEAPALRGADKSPADKFAAAEEDAQEILRNEEATKAKFEANCETLLKQINALDLAGTSGPNTHTKSEKQGLLDLVKEARKTAKSDIESAKDQLQVIRNRISLMAANPDGLLMHARKQVPAAERRWIASVQNYVKGLTAIQAAIDKVPAEDLDVTGRVEVDKQIVAVIALFRPSAFTTAVKAFQAAGEDKNKKSAAREQALSEIRRLRTTLLNDYRLQTLASCPFVKMAGLLSELNLSLLDLENNLLISL